MGSGDEWDDDPVRHFCTILRARGFAWNQHAGGGADKERPNAGCFSPLELTRGAHNRSEAGMLPAQCLRPEFDSLCPPPHS